MGNIIHDRIFRITKTMFDFSKESTWRGIVAVIACIGIILRPELMKEITAAAFGLIGAINMAKKD